MKETAATQYFFEPGISQIMLFFCTWQPPLWPYCPYVSPSSERNTDVTISSLNSAYCSCEQIVQCGANLDIYLCSNCFTCFFFVRQSIASFEKKKNSGLVLLSKLLTAQLTFIVRWERKTKKIVAYGSQLDFRHITLSYML